MNSINDQHTHRDGHQMGDFSKKTSIGNGRRKQGSYGKNNNGKKKSRGQGK